MPIEKVVIVNLANTLMTFENKDYLNLRGGITNIGFEISYGDNFSMLIHPATVKSISAWYKKE